MRKIDQNLINLTQEVYLWAYDRTGVTVGALSFVIFTYLNFSTEIHTGGSKFGLILVIVLNTFCTWWMHIAQRKSDQLYNAMAERWRRSLFRFAMLVWGFGGITVFSIEGDLYEVHWYLIMLVGVYFGCAKVRKRNPPEKKAALALSAN